MKRLFILLAMLMTATVSLRGQNYSATDEANIQLAIKLFDSGNIKQAIPIYEDLLKRYPGDGTITYELAYCYYVMQDFAKVDKMLSKAEKGKDVIPEIYAMHGNCLDEMGKRKQALAKYKQGMKLFPNCGQLYLETGTIYLMENDYGNAINSYETGIKADPTYPSNYYRLSQMLLASNEPVWGIIYAEIHQHLQPNSKRSEELSKSMYDAYNRNMKMETDSTYRVTLTSANTIQVTQDLQKILPFELVFEALSTRVEDIQVIKEKGHLDMLTLTDIRKNVITNCCKEPLSKAYYIPIFKYQKKVLDAGHWEAYNMWLLRKGNEEEYNAWMSQNSDKFIAFIQWFEHNRFNPATGE